MRRTQSVSVGLSSFAFFCRLRDISIFLLISRDFLFVILRSTAKQTGCRPCRDDASTLARLTNLTAELQQRIQTLESAKQSGDPIAVSTASKSVLGLALRELGGIELTQGSSPAAIDDYRRSNDFENSSATRVDLAQAYFQARRFDESLSLVTDVLVADPNDAHAWYVQGKLWITKQWYGEAVKSFQHVLSLKDDPAASYLLGAALLQTKECDQARIVFRELQEAVTDRAMHRMLADAYRAADDLDDFKCESTLGSPEKKPNASASPPRRCGP